MPRRVVWGFVLLILLVAASSTSAAFAAPAQQEETPTPTLGAPPSGGGLVAVSALVVRAGPDQSWFPLGSLGYGAEVFPIGRSGFWVAIPWEGELDVGWIASSLIDWDPALNLQSLPIIPAPITVTPGPQTVTAGPSPTPTPVVTITRALTETPTPSDGATATGTATFTPTVPPTVPPPTATETLPVPTVPPPTASPLPPSETPTDEAVIIPPVEPGDESPTNEPTGVPPPLWLWVALGTLGLAVLVYALRFIWGRRQLRRYAGGFVIETCPACQIGTLELEEVRRVTLGLTSVNRSVRCDTCRSVLRQVRPGIWRYNIDKLFNPALAEAYNGRQFSDAALVRLQDEADEYEPVLPEPEEVSHLSPEEIIAELEAQYQAAIEHEAENGSSEEPEEENQ